jgi:hypothetical protein
MYAWLLEETLVMFPPFEASFEEVATMNYLLPLLLRKLILSS